MGFISQIETAVQEMKDLPQANQAINGRNGISPAVYLSAAIRVVLYPSCPLI